MTTTYIVLKRHARTPTVTQNLSLMDAYRHRELKQKRRAIRRARLHLLWLRLRWGLRSMFKVGV